MNVPCTVSLPIFEGPLDLLLHLIKRSEVEITDIPIATITDQYLAMLDELPELNLDGAGEYLVMAATLVYIKSRTLLPTVEDEDVEEDPRAELVQQLLEYQRYREVAVTLGELLEHGEVLVGDGGDRDVAHLDLVALDQVEEQVERPFEDGKPDGAGRHASPMAARTSAIVSAATARARALPASRTARASSGPSLARRSRIGSSSACTCLMVISLHSRQPMPAVRHPSSW